MVGIIILNYKTYDMTIKCVQSIFDNTSFDYKIYIVDNLSCDGSYEGFMSYFANNSKIEILKSNENGGYSKGNNIGIRKAIKDGADYLIISNSDVLLLNNAFEILYYRLKENPDIFVAGPSITSLDGEEQQFARKKLDTKGFFFDKKPLYWLRRFFPSEMTKRTLSWSKSQPLYSFMGMVSGCCFIINSNLFVKIGLFDENVFLFGEEDILAYKLAIENEKVTIISDAKILHLESHATSKKGNAFIRYHRSISALYVLKQYGRINNFSLFLAFINVFLPFLLMSLFVFSYRKFVPELLKQYLILSR